MKPRIHRLVACLAAISSIALLVVACGDDGLDDGAQLEISTSPLLGNTELIYFSVGGDGLTNEAIGGLGTIDDNWIGRISINRVPEGRKTVRAYGLSLNSPSVIVEPPLPDVYYTWNEEGLNDSVSIISQNQTNARVVTSQVGDANERFGVESFLLMGSYDFDAQDRHAGSPGGANITRGVVSLMEAAGGCNLRVAWIPTGDVLTGPPPKSPVGLFPLLPDGDWPDPTLGFTWPATLDTATLMGQASFYVVAKPGSSGRDVILEVTPGSESGCTTFELGSIFLRIGGFGGLSAETTDF